MFWPLNKLIYVLYKHKKFAEIESTRESLHEKGTCTLMGNRLEVTRILTLMFNKNLIWTQQKEHDTLVHVVNKSKINRIAYEHVM